MRSVNLKHILCAVAVAFVVAATSVSCGKREPQGEGTPNAQEQKQSNAQEKKSATIAPKVRTVLVKIDKLDNGEPVRVAISSEHFAGIKLATLGAGYRMTFSMANDLMPEITYKTARSEFLVQPGLLMIGDLIVNSDKDFPAILKIQDNGEVVWLAGKGIVQPKDGFPAIQSCSTDIQDYLTLTKSSAPMDREEAAYSLGVLARPLSDRSRVIDALKKLLKDSDEFVRLTAAESIGLLGDRTALPALQEVADKDRSEWVRQVAREAIESVNKGVSTPREGNTYWLPRMF
jgi:hypothetical protein